MAKKTPKAAVRRIKPVKKVKRVQRVKSATASKPNKPLVKQLRDRLHAAQVHPPKKAPLPKKRFVRKPSVEEHTLLGQELQADEPVFRLVEETCNMAVHRGSIKEALMRVPRFPVIFLAEPWKGTAGWGVVLNMVDSSNVFAVGYDVAFSRLVVVFKGGAMYRYEDVPPETALELLTADSPGRTFDARIKRGGFRYRKITL